MNQQQQMTVAEQAQNMLANARSARPSKPAVQVKVEIGVPYHRFSFDKNLITIIKPNGEKVRAPGNEVNGVIIGSAVRPGRVYFRGTYGDGQGGQPECISRDGRTPVDLPGKQADLCANCPQNVPGSGSPDGSGDFKACSMTLPIVMVPVVWDDAAGAWISQNVPVLLRVSASAFMDDVSAYGMGYKAYNALLDGASVNLSEVVTRISVNHDNDTSCVPNFLNVDYADDTIQEALAGVLEREGELINMMTDVAGFASPEEVGAPPEPANTEATPATAPAQLAAQPAAPAAQPAAPAANETVDTETGEVLLQTPAFDPATPDQMTLDTQPTPAEAQAQKQAAVQAAADAQVAKQAEVDAPTQAAPKSSPRRGKAAAPAAAAQPAQPAQAAEPAPMGGAGAGDFSL